jgi:hypothetical protein
MSDPIDDLFSALRSAALPNELDGMAAAVDAMHDALVENLEPTMRPTAIARSVRHRRAPVAVLIAAGVLGFAGVAAAGPGGFLTDNGPVLQGVTSSTTSTSSTSSTTSTTSTVDPNAVSQTTMAPTTAPSTTMVTTTSGDDDQATSSESETTVAGAPPVDDPDTEFDETQCAEGNHGQTVSSVAHATDPGPEHGQAVSEAAQSSCGKQESDDNEADDQSDDDAVTTTVASTQTSIETETDDEGEHQNNDSHGKGSGEQGQSQDHGKSDKSHG